MKEFNDLINYINSIPQNNQLNKEMIVRKITEKRNEFTIREGNGPNPFIRKEGLVVKEGDLVAFDISGLPHPAIIISCDENGADLVVLSTKDREHSITKIQNSRMFPTSYITTTMARLDLEWARNKWWGVFDNPKELKRIKKCLKSYYSKLFSNAPVKTKKEEASENLYESRQDEDGSCVSQGNAEA